jgi:RNA polymerase sigma-70 factor (ECF subfamily)
VTERSEIELVRSAAAGDGDCFCDLCGRYYAAMVAIAHSVTGERAAAEDAAQETFAKAAIKLGSLRNHSKFGSWLAAICRNTAADIVRRNTRLASAERLGDIPAENSDNSNVELVRRAIGSLDANAREVIYLRYYDGLTYERIGKVLGISQQAINGRLRRAKSKIAEFLKAAEDYEA